ncbi:MAG: translation initiation factor IF-2, partial [Clostridia bacterium]|nr:translation initiation factor IF-2 [Clostridia bacterium]
FGGKRPYNPSQKPFSGKFERKPYAQKPLSKLGNAEVDIDLNALKNNDRTFGNKKKSKNEPQEHKQLSKKAQMRWAGDINDDDDSDRIGRRLKVKKKEVSKPKEAVKIENATITTENLTVKILSEQIGITVPEIVKKLFILGIMATVNSTIDFETAELVSNELGVKLEKKIQATAEEKFQTKLESAIDDDPSLLVKRPPIVTVMGHVDHGKTSLLDAVRKTNVVSGEAGGITQSIGASTTKINGRLITFIDTPGHAAFTAMRERGAQITDIAILVVAADDGIMPQTIEAIEDIRSAKVPMIVAINKVDKQDANIDRVMKGLADHGVLPEEWGGDTICVPISAKQNKNIDKLLEMVLLVADMQDLKANPNRNAIGTVIESRLDKGKGPVASILVQNGTLSVGDTVVTGVAFGRIRAMMDENGKTVKKATPSMPVQILGLDAVPQSGDRLMVVDEKMRAEIIAERKDRIKLSKIKSQSAVSIDDFFNKVKEGNLKNLNLLIKADVQGSAEALKQSLEKLSDEEVNVRVVHSAAGAVTESDITLAQVANAIVIAFNVRPVPTAKDLAERNEIEIKQYSVIYQAIDDVKLAMKGMLDPVFEEKVIGNVEVRQVFKVSNVGTIAGAYVLDGKIERNAGVRVLRENVVIHEGKLVS